MATLKNTIIANGSYFILPAGTDAQRPAQGEVGMVRINTERKTLEVWHSNRWRKVELELFIIS